MNTYDLLRPLLFSLPPEKAHGLSIRALQRGVVPCHKKITDTRLEVKLWNLHFPNPLGMAAGYDKNAEAYEAILKLGFGYVEVGSITPKPQSGNPQPRMFRLVEDQGVINRLGFNNSGMGIAHQHLSARDKKNGIVGVNIGKNKDTESAEEDYILALQKLYPVADYITVNISSPNTEGLRDLQQRDTLRSLLITLKREQKNLEATHRMKVPLLVKIAPDLSNQELEQIVEVILECNVEGLIVSNTTITRPSTLRNSHSRQAGGLSGQPLKQRSLEMLRKTYKLTEGRIPLIGVGGIGSAEDAIQRIKAGATLIQLYTAMIYNGPVLVTEILEGMLAAMEREGVASVREWVGVEGG